MSQTLTTQHASHPLFDIEERIIEARNQPNPVDLTFFQNQVDRIVGKTLDGKSRVRIVWGQDFEKTKLYFRGRWILKYPFYRYLESEQLCEIGKPRFFVEELHTNEELQTNGKWEASRYSHEGLVTYDDLGDVPEQGFYTELFPIAYHDQLCCNGREFIRGEPCLGAYREPNDDDLQRIRFMHYMRETAPNDEVAPSPELIQKRAVEKARGLEEKWRQGISDTIDDFMKTHAWRFGTFDPAELSWGKYHFMKSHSKSGLLLKNAIDKQDQMKLAGEQGSSVAESQTSEPAASDSQRPTGSDAG